jgi:hypothetical protein
MPEQGADPHNISTEHQDEGDAMRPADTLDRKEQPWAKDFQPGRDEGKAEPSGDDADDA